MSKGIRRQRHRLRQYEPKAPLVGHDHWGCKTDTYWDDRVIGCAEAIVGYQGEWLPMMQGCLGDHTYEEYFMGQYPKAQGSIR